MTLPTAFSLPGIVREEKITRSPGLSEVALECWSSAMRASAARGSPWLPVASASTFSRGNRSNGSGPRNGGSPSR